jgi:predicted nucleic acid-binding protein
VDRGDPASGTARRAIRNLAEAGHRLCIMPQIAAEFWVVCTKSKQKNGLGYATSRVQRYIERFESLFSILFETEQAYREWKRLVMLHSVIGAEAHDTRLVAAMVIHGIENIVTFNGDDFKFYDGIRVIHPDQL